jgi:crotonobetainyl-CoA:carnitine CoA-transferase CaiB-like acyl-CoA transferase
MMDAVASFLWADSAANEVLLESDHSQNSSFVAGFKPIRFSDGWGIVTPTSVADFSGMCKAFGVEGWDDPRLATLEDRNKNREVTAVLVDLCYAHAANMTMADATARLEAERVPFAMVLSPDELTRDAHAVAVGLFEEREHHVVGRTRFPRHPAQFLGTPAHTTDASPALGEHTDEILTELGLAERIGELRRTGVVS